LIEFLIKVIDKFILRFSLGIITVKSLIREFASFVSQNLFENSNAPALYELD